ncbi:FG-GAP repeat domain-containing protein [Engelhardtia mirabilis]|uniref:FG-GAP repeat protein n=1 Tax=Engelhardtia mirabilis TaxID=2528011 RepID=A0A518BPL8_9BACT|nr:FG-GAP repeat protein [Planctomycetes bacterium Pla133]QDV03247.1 FG-GAP repeat protein [Planctomycetes bacterium Pla86]
MLERSLLACGLAPLLLAQQLPVATAQQSASAVALDAAVAGSDESFFPRLSLQGTTVVGEPFSLTVRNAGPSNLGLVAWSIAQQPVFSPALQGILYPGAPLFVEGFTVGGALDAEGLLATAVLPQGLSGITVTAQAATFSILAPGFFRLTDALELRFGPAPRSRAAVGSVAYGMGLGSGTSTIEDAFFTDIDGDGTIDVVATPTDAAAIQLPSKRLGTGDGGFGPSELVGFINAERIRVGDLTSDGEPDLVTFDVGGSEILVYDNVNAFLPGLYAASLPAGTGLRDAQVVDFDNDGDLDVVAFSFSPPELVVHRNEGAAVFNTLPPVAVPFGNNAFLDDGFGFAIADFDSDGIVDYALANGLGELRIMKGTTSGVGGLLNSVALSGGGIETGLTAIDLLQNGDMSLAVAKGDAQVGPYSYTILVGDGTGAFTFDHTLSAPRPVGAIRAGDVEGDGDLDLILAVSGADLFTDAYFVEHNFNSHFPSSFSPPRPIPLGSPAVALELLDGDADGDLDFYAASGSSGEATVVQWIAGSGFATPLDFPLAGPADSVRLTDVDGDGALDALVRNSLSGEVWIHHGNGDRTFGAGTLAFVDQASQVWDVFDLDGNGVDEIVIAPDQSPSSSKLVVYRNVSGVYERMSVFGATIVGRPYALAVGQFFGGSPESLDIAVVSVRDVSGSYRLYVNLFSNDDDDLISSNQLFLLPVTQFANLEVFTSPAGMAVSDVDGDGLDEVLATSSDLPGADGLLVGAISLFEANSIAVSVGGRAVGAAPRSDLDLDGLANEVLLASQGAMFVRYYEPQNGSIASAAESQFSLTSPTTERLLLGELGRSDYADAVALGSQGIVTLASGSGGATSLALRDPVRAQFGGQITDLTLGDLDGDGVDEIVAIHYGIDQRLVVSTAGE